MTLIVKTFGKRGVSRVTPRQPTARFEDRGASMHQRARLRRTYRNTARLIAAN